MTQSAVICRIKAALRAVCPRPILTWREVQYFKAHGDFELGFVKDLCRPALDAIDIGANEGSYIHFMRPHARHVYAFEPIPWLADQLRGKFRRRVDVKTIALSDAPGQARLRIPVIDGQLFTGLSSLDSPAGEGTEFRDIEVETATLDSVYGGNVGFIKIDVEGHEDAVLAGARQIIARCRPRVQIEIVEYLSPGGLQRTADFFAAYGYRGFFVHDGRLKPLSEFDRESMQREELVAGYGAGIGRTTFGKYVANFFFFPDDEPALTYQKIRETISRSDPPSSVRSGTEPVAA